MELLNYSEVSELNGKASFKLGQPIFELEFIQDSDTKDGEEPQFWQMTIEGSNSLSVKMIPSRLPWSLPGKTEVRASFLLRPDLEPGMVMHLAEAVILHFGLLIAAEDDVPDWLTKVMALIDDLTDDFAGNTLPSSWFSEE